MGGVGICNSHSLGLVGWSVGWFINVVVFRPFWELFTQIVIAFIADEGLQI